MVRNLPAVQETRVQSLGWEDPLEEEMATHSSILAWDFPWTEKPGGLQSMGSQRVGHDWAINTFTFWWLSGKESACKVGNPCLTLDWEDLEEEMETHSSILAWENPMDRGAWWARVYRVAKSRKWLSDWAHRQAILIKYCQESNNPDNIIKE